MTTDAGPIAELLGGRSLLLLGCGRMGSALLEGWLSAGAPSGSVCVLEPAPSESLSALSRSGAVALNPGALPDDPAAAVVAVKPQTIDAALPALLPAAEGLLVVSIAAGIPVRRLEAALPGCRAVRTMPNTPAAIRRGVSALFATPATSEADRELADALLGAAGATVWLDSESDMDAVTAVSGSGPAWVFALIEALGKAGEAEGLPRELARVLARQTVVGAGALVERSDESPEALREAVTSPAGTTAAGLERLLDPDIGLDPLIRRTVRAAARRSRELAGS